MLLVTVRAGPVVIGGGGSAGSGRVVRERESTRGTVFGELNFSDFMDRQTPLAKALGRHVLTYSGAMQRAGHAPDRVGELVHRLGLRPDRQFVRRPGLPRHREPDLSGLGSDQCHFRERLDLPRITAVQQPVSPTVKNWDATTKTYKAYPLPVVNPNDPSFNDQNRPYLQASKNRDEINSQVFVWQGHFFNGAIVPMVGWRKDVAENFNAGDPQGHRHRDQLRRSGSGASRPGQLEQAPASTRSASTASSTARRTPSASWAMRPRRSWRSSRAT
jgi:hypothetical protein